jgi:hypothetical protein
MMESRMNPQLQENWRPTRLARPAFAGAGGQFATSLHPRFAPIRQAIGLARDAQICSQIASPSSHDLMKYPGYTDE